MSNSKQGAPTIEEVAAFHGHMCPGLALGYRAALLALDWLQATRADDEQTIAIVENRACGIDALQCVLGTTAGKGNLFFKDYGKHVYTIADRITGKALRVSVRPKGRWGREGETREETIKRLLVMPADDLFDAREIESELPPKAEIVQSLICDSCGESTMETKTRQYRGTTLCIPCFEQRSASSAC
ncbi:MAG TPA: FmdE family protein [Candidatus Aquicultor sp.]